MTKRFETLAPTRAIIDLAALRHNVSSLHRAAPGVQLIGVVKANAYGHGSVRISRELIRMGVSRFAVATITEAIELREAGIQEPVLLFGRIRDDEFDLCRAYDLEVTIADRGEEARPGNLEGLRIHINIDTGMGRQGIPPDSLGDTIRWVEQIRGARLAGIWTHFATAEAVDSDFTTLQWTRFKEALDALGPVPAPVHAAGSAAVFTIPEAVDPAIVTFARTGIALYGLLETIPPLPPATLRPVMTLQSTISQIKTVPPGTSISYGRRWFASRTTRIATVAAGYADGFPRALSNRTHIGIRGDLFPVVGTVCMDMFMVDLGAPDGPGKDIQTGEKVDLIGGFGPTAMEVARTVGTIPYEIVCHVGDRVPRIYVDSDSVASS